ncbi:nickel pincer cofactor biosynthesis protein LarC [Halorientalis pallida]|uniref:Putative nickel insertion protein n=1 Tax=Halorientalis pallida TaxID=2479928 RepID=A0A498L4R6_9EURY|nr:nickel pincer cofactor biosynthesis protein LarC [Halorientalis pallida]RXK51624.1 nickel pincer cofactor biosynthesis protein LarC [Halorientalis pallida]
MRTLAFDGRMGASGDMLLGALLAAGADRDALAPVETAPTLDVTYALRTVEKTGISATAVDVLLTDEESGADQDQHGHDQDHHDHTGDGTHDHSPDAEHGHGGDGDGNDEHAHTREGEHTHAEGHGPHRTYAEVVEIVDGLDLPARVAADARSIFEILGEAEAAVHGTDLADTHFHEVGADDAIADVVGACLLLDDLGVDRVVTTPLSTGGGEVAMSHGTYPVPTPAVVEIAERADWALRGGPVDVELLTPTGASILAHVAEGVDRLPSLRVDASGYGAGGYDFADHPNVLRAVVGDGGGGLQRDEITVLETNLDDAPPEVLGGLQDRLADAGARDVSIVPLTMKKSRPGHLVKVIVKPEDADRVARRLAEETGTLGVREHGAGHRWVASRDVTTTTVTVDGETYDVAVKVASDAEGTTYDVSAEYDDALAVAQETDLPVRDVMRRAEDTVRDEGGEEN